jgi:FixJ family two-component response regulator
MTAWIEELPNKDPVDLLRDQVILLSAIQQSLAQMQRQQAHLIQAVDQLSEAREEETEVCVTDVEMPFLSMVVLIIKWGLAMIPAAVILTTLAALVVLGLTALGWLPPAR